MADAYATIADGGWRNRPTLITKIDLPNGKSELPRRWRIHRTKVVPDGVTYKATQILEENIQAGTGTHANIGCPAAGKTGTTDHNTDAWFVGFTPRLATAVWVGYPNDRTEMNGLYFGRNVDGGTYPADIWGAYMKQAIGSHCDSFPLPTVPFVSAPFFGKYARNGQQSTPSQSGTVAPSTTPTTQPNATRGGGGGNGTGGGVYNPGAYESPPQGPPPTVTPGNNGNGNGGGNGTGNGTNAVPGTTPQGTTTPPG
jgi:penicillin-binding protein 1A